MAAAAVLVAQLIMGLVNDLARRRPGPGSRRRRQADRRRACVAAGNASFAVAVLLLLVDPAVAAERHLRRRSTSWPRSPSATSTTAGCTAPCSPGCGWAATFAHARLVRHVGGWGSAADGSAPYTWFAVLCGLLGICVHFLTSLPDLVRDNASRVRHLPLRVALHTGAPKLLVISVVATVLVVGDPRRSTAASTGAIAQ